MAPQWTSNPYSGVAQNHLAVTCAKRGDLDSAACAVNIARALGYLVHPHFLAHLKQEHSKKKQRW